jgi:PiT family inorganic phosphate transporter
MSQELLLVIALALLFDFLNGLHDSSNIVATMISSRAFRPGVALALAGAAEFVGPFVFGVAVARTVGDEIARSEALNLDVIAACLVGAIGWNLITWFLGMPSSSSHALIGGILGAVLAGAGPAAVQAGGLYRVLLALFASPVIGFIAGFGITRLIFLAARNASPAINTLFRRAQLVTAVGMAFSHGTNDAQKTMGIITLSLVIGGAIPAFHVPLWVIAASAGAIALGTSFGSWRLIRTLGGKFYKVRPVHGFSAQLTSALVILSASLVGAPVSTTQVVSSAIIGVGSSERLGQVRWGVVGGIVTAWLITIPSSALLSAGVYWLLVFLTP